MKKMFMNYRAFALSALALALLTVSVPASAQQSDGPIRQGVRSAAQGTAQATRRAGEATRDVIGGAAGAARRTGEAARNLGQGNRAGDQTYQGQYGAGYRGLQQSSGSYVNTGRAYQLRHDASGREYICVCGQRVYFDNQPQLHQTAKPVIDDVQSGQGTQDNQSGQQGNQSSPPPTPTPEDQSSGNPQEGQHGTSEEASSPQQSAAQSQSGSDAPSNPENEGGNAADSQQGASQNPPEPPAEPAKSVKLD